MDLGGRELLEKIYKILLIFFICIVGRPNQFHTVNLITYSYNKFRLDQLIEIVPIWTGYISYLFMHQ